jgi:hypothetical protein
VGLIVGSSGSQITFGSTSLFLSDARNPSIAFGAAPEGGVQILFGGPPIIFSSALVSAGQTWGESLSEKSMAASPEIPAEYAERAFLSGALQFPDPVLLQTADDLFGVS